MEKFLELSLSELVPGIALFAILVAVAIYLIGRVRGEAAQHEPGASELISKFRELHAKGELSDSEFRTIKTQLAVQLGDELKDNDQTG